MEGDPGQFHESAALPPGVVLQALNPQTAAGVDLPPAFERNQIMVTITLRFIL